MLRKAADILRSLDSLRRAPGEGDTGKGALVKSSYRVVSSSEWKVVCDVACSLPDYTATTKDPTLLQA